MKKRLTAVLLCAAMVLGLTACSGKESSVETAAQTTAPATEASLAEGGAKTPQDFKKFKIGVCEPQAIDEVVIRREYDENYLAARDNVEFVF